jgi:segregation and condensation protein A
MIERTVPWWRRALEFALDGIRLRLRLLRRGAQIEPALPVGAASALAADPEPALAAGWFSVEAREETVASSSPQPEAAPVKAVKAADPLPVSVAEQPPQPPVEPQSAHGLEPESRQEAELPAEPFESQMVKPVEKQEPEPVPEQEPEPAEEPVVADPEPQPAEPEQFEEPVGSDPEPPAVERVPVEEPTAEAEPAALPATEPESVKPPAVEPEQMESPDAVVEAVPSLEVQAAPEPEAVETPVPDPESPASVADEPAFEPASASPATEPVLAQPATPVAPQQPAPAEPVAAKPERTTAEKVAAMLKARGEDAEQSPFSVTVSLVYDGPLDLLLDLIRKQDIDIYDIPIAKITAQFLAYVDHLRASDMDVAGEFIYTAALLIHIKSKMLLPRAPAGPEEPAEDPRRELVERLLEHERFKNAAQMLHEKQMLEAASWTNPGVREFRENGDAEPEIAADTTDLVRIFRDILDRARNRPMLDLEEDSVTVGQMIQFLARRLTIEDKPVALRRLLSHTRSERALIAMFLALLELVRLQAILLRQDRQFSEIFIKKQTGFDAMMNQGLAEAHDDWR